MAAGDVKLELGMSIEIMSQVWKKSSHAGGELLVLLALADYANHDGFCWPSLASLAHRSRLTVRQVRRVLRKLEKSEEIHTVLGTGKGHPSTYTVKADKMSGFKAKEDMGGSQKRTFRAAKEDTHVRRSVSEPSGDPSWLQKQASKEAELVQTKEQADIWVKQYSSLYGGFPYLPDAIKTALGFPP